MACLQSWPWQQKQPGACKPNRLRRLQRQCQLRRQLWVRLLLRRRHRNHRCCCLLLGMELELELEQELVLVLVLVRAERAVRAVKAVKAWKEGSQKEMILELARGQQQSTKRLRPQLP